MALIFEVIKNDSDILIATNNQTLCTVTVKDKGFYFTKAASKLYGFQEGKYLQMVRGKNEKKLYTGCWYFAISDDESGFPITKGSHDAYSVHNKPIRRLFCQFTKAKLGDKFYLQDTGSELNGSPVIEIMTAKSVQQLLKEA